MIVRELVTLLGFKVNDAQMANAERGVRKVKDSAEQLGNTLKNALGAYLGFQSIKSIIAAGDEFQSLRARIGQLPQTVGDVAASFDRVAARAINARQSISEYSGFYIKAGNATQDFINSQDDLMRIVDGAAFGLAASGASAVTQGQAFFQLGQAIGSPVVQMEEMNTLIDAAPDLFRALGNVIPGASGNLKAFISTGAVTGKMLAEGLIKVAPIFEKKMKGIPLTVGEATQQVVGRFKLMIDQINRETFFIEGIANGLVDVFNKLEKWAIDTVSAFGGLENMIRFIGIAIGVAFGAKTIQILLNFQKKTALAMLKFILIAAAILAVAVVIEDLYVAIKGGDSVIGRFWKWLNGATFAAKALKIALLVLGTVGFIAGFIYANVLAVGLAKAAGAMLMLGVRALIVGGQIALGWLLAIWPIALLILAIAAVGTAGYLLIKNWQTVKDWFASLFNWFGDKFSALGDWIDGLLVKAGKLVGITDEAGGWTGSTGRMGGTSSMGVSPSQMAASANGQGRPNVNSTTNVTVTVPPGTTAEQANFLKESAKKSFGSSGGWGAAGDIAMIGP